MMSKPQRVGLIAESSSSETSQQNRTKLMLPISPGRKVGQREQKALSLLALGIRREKGFMFKRPERKRQRASPELKVVGSFTRIW